TESRPAHPQRTTPSESLGACSVTSEIVAAPGFRSSSCHALFDDPQNRGGAPINIGFGRRPAGYADPHRRFVVPFGAATPAGPLLLHLRYQLPGSLSIA